MSQNATAAMEPPSSPEQFPDRHLARRLARAEAGSFEELVELHAEAVTRMARGLLGLGGDVDDVVQDVFVIALEKAPRFRGHCSLRTWLTVITLNRCRTCHRRQKIWRRVAAFLGQNRADEPPTAGPQGIDDEARRAVRTAVASLPPTDREAVVLHYFEHMSPA
jgi:RNA polymerase sigma factor (sigma-70 family)